MATTTQDQEIKLSDALELLLNGHKGETMSFFFRNNVTFSGDEWRFILTSALEKVRPI